jgi:ABC-type ATPase involved in cell division
MVFQEDRLLEQLTVLDNLALVSHGKPENIWLGC